MTPPLLAPLCLLHHWEVSEVATAQHLLPVLRWAMLPDNPHCPPKGCTGMDHEKWGWELGCWFAHVGTSVRGCPVQSGLSPVVYSLCPPVLQFWRGGKHPYYGVELFFPQSHGTMAGFKEEYHLLWRMIDGAMWTFLHPWKVSFLRENPLQTGRWKEKWVFPLYKEN